MTNIILNSELSSYRDSVRYLADNKLDFAIPNGGDEHALIVFEEIFNHAIDEINIACGELNADFTSSISYKSSLKKFLYRENVKLNILLTSANFNENALLNSDIGRLLSEFSDKVLIRHTKDYFYDETTNVIHFCVADKRMYRYETDVKARKATVNMNDSNTSKLLNIEFAKCFEIARQINISNQ